MNSDFHIFLSVMMSLLSSLFMLQSKKRGREWKRITRIDNDKHWESSNKPREATRRSRKYIRKMDCERRRTKHTQPEEKKIRNHLLLFKYIFIYILSLSLLYCSTPALIALCVRMLLCDILSQNIFQTYYIGIGLLSNREKLSGYFMCESSSLRWFSFFCCCCSPSLSFSLSSLFSLKFLFGWFHCLSLLTSPMLWRSKNNKKNVYFFCIRALCSVTHKTERKNTNS